MKAPLALLVLSAASVPVAAQEVRAAGDHFEVVLHFAPPPEAAGLAERALAVVEAVWPPASALYGLDDDPLESKLPVHVYRNAADYLAAETPLAAGRFARNLAFAHWDTRSAHVAIQPDRSDALLAEIGLGFQTERLLVHEAAHLVRFHACPAYREQPRWFADATASWIDRRVLDELGLVSSPDEDPFLASYSVLLQRMRGSGRLPSFDAVLDGAAEELEFRETYAVHAHLFDVLEKLSGPKALARLCRTARKVESDVPDRLRELLLGRRSVDRLDAACVEHVESLSPGWEELYHTLETAGEAWTQTAFPDKNAIAWRTAPLGEGEHTVRGSLCVLPAKSTQLNLLLDRSDDGFVQVCFVPGTGVTVFEYDSRADAWESRARAEVELRVGAWHSFEAVVSEQRLQLTVDGERCIDVRLDRAMEGPWGLGAYAGSAGRWKVVSAR